MACCNRTGHHRAALVVSHYFFSRMKRHVGLRHAPGGFSVGISPLTVGDNAGQGVISDECDFLHGSKAGNDSGTHGAEFIHLHQGLRGIGKADLLSDQSCRIQLAAGNEVKHRAVAMCLHPV